MKAIFWEIDQNISRFANPALDANSEIRRDPPILRYCEVDEPQIPNDTWLKARNRCCGLCCTDVQFISKNIDYSTFAFAVMRAKRKFLGHEVIAEVVEVGKMVKRFKIGDLVGLRTGRPSCFQMQISPPCSQCASGYYRLCENVGTLHLPVDIPGGGLSSYMVMHESQPYLIPRTMSESTALLLEPMACAVHSILKAKLTNCGKVLVIGGGTIGLLIVAALKRLSPMTAVSCLVRYPFQGEIVKKSGATVVMEGPDLDACIASVSGARCTRDASGNNLMFGGFDIVYDAVGSDFTVQNALRWVRARGTVVLIGINLTPGHIDYSPIWSREVNVLGANAHATEKDGRASFDIAAELLMEGSVSPNDIITHRFALDQYEDAIHAFMTKRDSKAIKIVIDVS